MLCYTLLLGSHEVWSIKDMPEAILHMAVTKVSINLAVSVCSPLSKHSGVSGVGGVSR